MIDSLASFVILRCRHFETRIYAEHVEKRPIAGELKSKDALQAIARCQQQIQHIQGVPSVAWQPSNEPWGMLVEERMPGWSLKQRGQKRETQEHIQSEVRRIMDEIRRCGFDRVDLEPQNIVYHSGTREVSLVDYVSLRSLSERNAEGG